MTALATHVTGLPVNPRSPRAGSHPWSTCPCGSSHSCLARVAEASALQQRFHSTAREVLVRCCVADSPLPKRPPGDAPGRTRTCDPLLRRREHLLRSTAACRSVCSTSDGPHIAAALCCGLPLPPRFHWSRSRWAELPRSRSHTKGAALPTRGSALSIGFAALLPSRAAARGRASLQSRVVSESMATVIARMRAASSPAATSTP